jgi:Na+(H+)/acetate symporter ActP
METLLTLITIVQRANGKRLLLKLFSRLMVVLGLIITTAIMVSATLLGGLLHAHIALLNSGMASAPALLLIGAAALLIIALLIAMVVWQMKYFRPVPKPSPLMNTLDAFTDGLMAD